MDAGDAHKRGAEEVSSKFVGLLLIFQAKGPYPDSPLKSRVYGTEGATFYERMESLRSVTGENNGLLLLFSFLIIFGAE